MKKSTTQEFNKLELKLKGLLSFCMFICLFISSNSLFAQLPNNDSVNTIQIDNPDLPFSHDVSAVESDVAKGVLSNSENRPTLLEWGFIILASLLMTLGSLYLMQPNFKSVFEKELKTINEFFST